MTMFLAQLIIFVVSLKCFKEVVGLIREWIHELVCLLSPSSFRKRKEVKEKKAEFEAEAEAELKREKEEKENNEKTDKTEDKEVKED